MKIMTVAVFLGLLFLIAAEDWKTMEIPDTLLVLLLVLSVVSMKTMPDLLIRERLLGAVSASGILFVISCLIPGAFGGGDIKLMVVCGLFLGWRRSLVALYLAILTGGIYGAILLGTRRKCRSDHIPFGPFLCLGMLIALFRSEQILSWYRNLCGM